jgi:hypothetical protein
LHGPVIPASSRDQQRWNASRDDAQNRSGPRESLRCRIAASLIQEGAFRDDAERGALMSAAVLAGLLYGLAIFSLGFALGTLRELILAPLIGRQPAVLIETPIILIASWFVAGWIIARRGVPALIGRRLAMGAAAFLLLMLGEALVAVGLMQRGLMAHLSGYLSLSGFIELLPQIAFALFPALHLLRRSAGRES